MVRRNEKFSQKVSYNKDDGIWYKDGISKWALILTVCLNNT